MRLSASENLLLVFRLHVEQVRQQIRRGRSGSSMPADHAAQILGQSRGNRQTRARPAPEDAGRRRPPRACAPPARECGLTVALSDDAALGHDLGLGPRQPFDDDVQAAVRARGPSAGRPQWSRLRRTSSGSASSCASLVWSARNSIRSAGQCAVHRLHGRGPVDGQGLERQRENDQLPERDDGELAGVRSDGFGHCRKVYSIG